MPWLHPVDHLSPARLEAGQRDLVLELAWASVSGAFSGGVILVAFSLALGANALQVGLLAAIPFFTQVAQLPATVLIERTRQRRKLSVLALTAARGLVLLLAGLPLLAGPPSPLSLLIVAYALIALLNAVGGCAINSWLHQLIPHSQLGQFFARRLFSGTTLACLGTLAAGLLVERGPFVNPLHGYALAFAIGGLAGFASSAFLARAPEPRMQDAGPQGALRERLEAPFRDLNFRRLLVFLAAWTVAANFAGPFVTVYLIEQHGYALGTVTALWVASQFANALTVYWWGRLSDRLTNKAVLAVVLPLYFASLLALVFVSSLRSEGAQLASLYAVHLAMGIATGGIGLAVGNLGLKLAPHGQGTAYLAAIGLVTAVAGGLAPLVAGWTAQALQTSELTALVRWASHGGETEMRLVSFAHWEFLFALAALMGLYVMHALSRVNEGREISERLVIQEFAMEAWQSISSLASAGGALGSLFPFERLSERRKWWRAPRRHP